MFQGIKFCYRDAAGPCLSYVYEVFGDGYEDSFVIRVQAASTIDIVYELYVAYKKRNEPVAANIARYLICIDADISYILDRSCLIAKYANCIRNQYRKYKFTNFKGKYI